jgi:hypothetical protein
MDVKSEAVTLKKALEKADAENSHSAVRDVLQALLSMKGMTEGILKETKFGKALKEMKAKYDAEDPTIGKMIMDILKIWTRIAKQAKKASEDSKSPQPGKSNKSGSSNTKIEAPNSNLAFLRDTAGPVTPQRQKIIDLFVKTLSIANSDEEKDSEADSSISENTLNIASGIEAACFVEYPCDKDGKLTNYTAKVRTLNFNLKKNADLRSHVLRGLIVVSKLLTMNADELAVSHLVQQRAREAAEDEESRRQDWTATHEAEIVRSAAEHAGLKVKAGDVFKFDDESEDVSDDD